MLRGIAPALALALSLTACDRPPPGVFQGYVEGEAIDLASPYAGQLRKLAVRRGEPVRAGQPVFTLERESELAARTEAAQKLKSAEARLGNLRAARRLPELDAIQAQLAQAKAARNLSDTQVGQQQKLFAAGFISQARLDEAQAASARDRARVAEAEAQLQSARQPLGRDAELQAAAAEVAAARAALEQSTLRFEQKAVAAPRDALVQDTFFVEGEWVSAGRPVVSLLPPGNVRARFYVPETVVGSLAPGRRVEISCDGCAAPVAAVLSYISPQAEYTPPVLYNRDARAKLVFLVEARPEAKDAARLRPGQPIDIRLAAGP
ncbi:MAG: HlyD family efflux transporter periplasmic adaptor subunit [Betaproteobacteria bacterium]|nr:HlyD family efflux transporter periplasmic adaptor subunit [Betaproteobacteria bacterium]